MERSSSFDFDTFVNTELNASQKEAVEHIEGALLVIAGAGSGKTRVITARIVNLLERQQVHPAQIIALTFTNKAAKEMKERIAGFLHNKQGIPFVGTFHGYCLYLLKQNTHLLPFDSFSIIDEDDKRSILNTILKKTPLYKKQTAQQLSYHISLIKNQCAHPDQGFSTGDNRMIQELVQEYEKEKLKSKSFDFDDLLLEAVKLFDNKEFQEAHHNQVRHILVDEYQDTNIIQDSLLKKMTLSGKTRAVDSVCVVGDEDQSIYSWRGATVDNIIHFTKDFKDAKYIKIEQNYRSKQPILHTANKVIAHNFNRNEKKLWSDQTGRDCVRMLRCFSGYQEADIIARLCKLLHGQKKLASTALLYRTHVQSRALEEALIKQGIPYHLVGGIRFYERKEIKDILAYLRLIINPYDRVAFTRAINCPLRGLGDVFVEQFTALWDAQPLLDFKGVAALMLADIQTSKKESLQKFVNLFEGLTHLSRAPETITKFLHSIEYIEFLKKSHETQEAQERQANVKEFLNAAHFFALQGKASLGQLLDEVSLLQEHTETDENSESSVTLMTLHAAKGLEFNTVIIPGLEEGLFPSSRSTLNPAQLEEERRLLYVGITRARSRLLLTYARYRQTYGQMEEAYPSRFIKEIPQDSCRTEDASSWNPYDISNYLAAWFGIASAHPEAVTFRAFTPPPTVITAQPATKISFKKHQTVKHLSFGIGIVTSIEEQPTKTVVTVQFKTGTKKLDGKFVQPL